MNFKQHSKYCLVTAILPRQSTHGVLEAVLGSGVPNALTQNARGTLIKDRWFQSFLPSLSPEQEVLQFLVSREDSNHLMEQIVMVGKLRLYGSGAIFSTPCQSLVCSEDFPLWTLGDYTFESVSFDIHFKKDLVALFHVTDKGQAEPITKAAIRAGAQGPTISYIRGFGLRDRLGLLRITKKHEKELIMVVVDRYDVDAVFQAMAAAGRVDQPGRGIIYQVPISKGLTNLASVFHAQKHSASIQQIIQAIDQMQGSPNWRAKGLHIHDPKADEFRESRRGVVKDQVVLNILCHRKDVDTLLYAALDLGIPGASASNWRFAGAHAEQTTGGLRLCREFGCLTMILSPDQAQRVIEPLQEVIREHEMRETCFFTCAVPELRRYSSGVSKAKSVATA